MKTATLSPAEVSDSSVLESFAVDEDSGTVAFVAARLARWIKIAPRGMAMVAFDSPQARQAVLTELEARSAEEGIGFQHIALPTERPAIEHIRYLATEVLPQASGVVTITGFQHAFTQEEGIQEALRLFNYNRENLVNFPVKQIWWMPTDLAAFFDNIAPELARYFLVWMNLTEVIHPQPDATRFEMLPEGPRLSVQEAKQLSEVYRERFTKGLAEQRSLPELVEQAGLAIFSLSSAGLIEEAAVLWNVLCTELRTNGLPIDDYLARQTGSESESIKDARNLTLIAHLYGRQEFYIKAEALYKHALAIWEKFAGQDSEDYAVGLNNLAWVYLSQGLYKQAQQLLEQALDIDEKMSGPFHPTLAISLNNLARVYKAQELYSKAESAYQRSITINEETNGQYHPNTAMSIHNLAVVYFNEGLYGKAEPLFLRALRIREQVLGFTHPDTAASLYCIGSLRFQQGRYAEAEQCLSKALAIMESTIGKSHSDTIATQESLNMARRSMQMALSYPLSINKDRFLKPMVVKPNPHHKKKRSKSR